MQHRGDLLDILVKLADFHSKAAELARQAYAIAATSDSFQVNQNTSDRHEAKHNGELLISSAACSVQWRGRRCVLGPSLTFRMIHHLSSHPNRFFTCEMLMDEVWQRRCTDDAVRALVKRLRHALVNAGMAGLASAIRGQGRCYGLFLDGSAP